jgi:hypothetical protein
MKIMSLNKPAQVVSSTKQWYAYYGFKSESRFCRYQLYWSEEFNFCSVFSNQPVTVAERSKP